MDLAYYIQAAKAAAPAVHAEDDDYVVELTPKAVLLKLEVQTGMPASVTASYKGSGLSWMGLGNAEAGGGGHALTCPECGKTFLSDKAMYGHLRSHPERGYKGATRPATASVAVGLGGKKPRKVPPKEHELSTKWPVTAKRGSASSTPGTGSAPVAAVQSSSWCSEEEEVAMILLDMASRGTTSKIQQPLQPVHARDAKHQIPDFERPMLPDHVAQNQVPELVQLMQPDHVTCAVMAHQTPETGQRIGQSELVPEVIVESQTRKVKELTELLEIPTKAVVVVVRDKSTSTPANQQPAAAPGSGAKKRRLPDSEKTSPKAAKVKPPARRIPSPASDKKHECPICFRSFPTHQALGGHTAGHNKGGSKHGPRHDDPAVVQAMKNILARRKASSDAIIGGTGTAEAAVAGAGLEGSDVDGKGLVCAVAGGGQEGAPSTAEQERRDVQPPAAPICYAPHVCPECNRSFPSGQALGGHKRKHWFPEKQAKAALAAAARSFDLNELPSDAEGKKPSLAPSW